MSKAREIFDNPTASAFELVRIERALQQNEDEGVVLMDLRHAAYRAYEGHVGQALRAPAEGEPNAAGRHHDRLARSSRQAARPCGSRRQGEHQRYAFSSRISGRIRGEQRSPDYTAQ
jgi:hypothetical protein